MIPLTLTVELDPGEADWHDGPDYGHAVVKIGAYEIGRVELTYNQWDDGRDGLEQAVAEWLAVRLAEK
jgi:hypothetical protein